MEQSISTLVGLANECDDLRAKLNRLTDLAVCLVTKMDDCHEHPRYNAVWQIAHLHIGPYDGPKYEFEFKNLRKALAPFCQKDTQ